MSPRIKKTAPIPSREKGQRSLEDPLYLTRVRIPFPSTEPEFVSADMWRYAVEKQPVCIDSREFLISSILSLEWKIEPMDSSMRDELKDEIEYYTNLIQQHGSYDYTHLIEWLGQDLLDIPFGGAMEIGRSGNSPNGRVMWYELLDGATCFPTKNRDWPIGQKVGAEQVYFPNYGINRIYMSPRTKMSKRGWGMAPPQKIYLALEMLTRADVYFASLLLDTPPTGILDLMNMSKTSAEMWVSAWKELLTGIDPYKIPVLYEHDQKAEWIDFTRNPSDIMFDVAGQRYISLVTSAYGISPSDIGLGGGGASGGDTLAGTIRSERKTRKTGISRLKGKFTAFFNRLLPSTLRFVFIDLDEETTVAKGRARLANSTSAGAYISNRVFSPSEMRRQAIADGLISISVPEDLPPDEEFPQEQNYAERPNMLGRPISPSSGGYGEVAARSEFEIALEKAFDSIDEIKLRKLMYAVHPILSEEIKGARSVLEDDLLAIWLGWHESLLWGDEGGDPIPELDLTSMELAKQRIIDSPELRIVDFPEDVINDLVSITQNTIDELIKEENTARTIRGEEEFKLESELDSDAIKELVMRKIGNSPEYLSKAIVSATRDFILLSDGNIEIEQIIMDGEGASSLAKGYVLVAVSRIIGEISSEISDIIDRMMKGVLNNGKTETDD